MSDVIVLWEPPSICSVNPTTWHGKLVAPVKTITFAKVSHRIDGQCYLALEPRGWDGWPRWIVDYGNAEVAKRHAEAWARVNWRRILRPEDIPFKPDVSPRRLAHPVRDAFHDQVRQLVYGRAPVGGRSARR